MSGENRRAGPAFAIWAVLAVTSSLPFVAASLWPPAGLRFNGGFYWLDDYYQYLSFAEQASRGAFLFTNKFAAGSTQAMLVNVEWWLAGVIAAVTGSSLDVGFNVLRLLALAALVGGASRVLSALGLPEGSKWRALGFVFVTGGLGVWRLVSGADSHHLADISLGLYPWNGLLLNAHFVFGSAGLLWTLLLHLDWSQGRAAAWKWVGLSWVLGFSRPYDLAVFVMVAVAITVIEGWREGAGATVRRLLPLAALVPVFLFYIALLGSSSMGGWANQGIDGVASPWEVLVALAPAVGLWLLCAPRVGGVRVVLELAEARRLLAWGAIVLGILACSHSPMAKQFAVGLALPFLLLAAAAMPRSLLLPATILLAPTPLFLLWQVLNPSGSAFSPRGHWNAVSVLRVECRPGDVVAGPPLDLTMMIAARTPCAVNVGHRLLTPHFLHARRESLIFYDVRTPVSWRAVYLARLDARFLLLPPGGERLLGAGRDRWRPIVREPTIEVWRREAAPGR